MRRPSNETSQHRYRNARVAALRLALQHLSSQIVLVSRSLTGPGRCLFPDSWPDRDRASRHFDHPPGALFTSAFRTGGPGRELSDRQEPASRPPQSLSWPRRALLTEAAAPAGVVARVLRVVRQESSGHAAVCPAFGPCSPPTARARRPSTMAKLNVRRGSLASRTTHARDTGAFAFALSLHNGCNDQEPT